ncbi:MAG TPA: NAD-dependent epimerase/dehydratase family protein, partial [Thermodesulfobacteriota bacterium]|nr:NAD-dependent epimerase/dehydratase family protein [Thermodesulfobacteriota bacterium]
EVTGLVRAVERARAVEALLNAARASGRPRVVVYTSGVWVLGHTGDRPADETAPTDRPASLVAWRPGHERLVLEAATDALATAVIRPGLVYGGTRGLVSELFASAVRTGAARYVGDGRNRWSLVHRADLAQLYRLVLERGGRGVFHGVDGVPVRVADAARAASEAAGRGGATQSQAVEEARRELGPLVEGLLLDQVVVARRSAELGWQPTRRSFLESAAAAYAEWRQ